ncbi:MAG: preprotein translocase subunit Sec61beta [Candidatus Diapherotrites archaeon]|nr:preprotein translocase subunit Sec61beta [Candidatus Diapherotrites archaeon]
MSSQLGLLRFSEEGSKGPQMGPKAVIAFAVAFGILIAAVNVFF